jgi:hypothetical protein
MTYRVIQWATGSVGSWGLRQIIDHPDLELAGVWVSSAAKDGRDAGELCGRPATGVLATTSKQAILDLDADVVIHCSVGVGPEGLLPFDDDVTALLESGKNVISTASYFSPLIEGEDRMATLEAACAKGGSTLYGSGIDPGFVCDRVAALLSGSVAKVEKIRMIESMDVSQNPGELLLSEVGFGKRPEDRSLDSPGILYYGLRLLPGAVAKLADLLGVKLDMVVPSKADVVLADRDMDVAMGRLKKGTIKAVLHEFSGMRDGEAFITHQWVTYMGDEGMPDDWVLAPSGEEGKPPPYFVRVEIDGRPGLKVDMVYTDGEDESSFSFPTATVCINSIPDVVAASPGFLQEKIFGHWRQPSS